MTEYIATMSQTTTTTEAVESNEGVRNWVIKVCTKILFFIIILETTFNKSLNNIVFS